MSNGLFFVYLIVGAIGAWWYVITPIIVSLNHRIAVDPIPEVIDRTNYPIPEALQERLDHDTEQFLAAGFQALPAFILHAYGPSIEYLSYGFVNRETRRIAAVGALLIATAQNRSLRSVETRIGSDYETGPIEGLWVGNSKDTGPYFHRDQELTFMFPHVTEVGRLLELLDRLEERHCRGAIKYLKVDRDFGGNVAASGASRVKLAFQVMCERGFLTRRPNEQQYRLPLWSTYVICWHTWLPMRAFFQYFLTRKAKRLERELMRQKSTEAL